MKNINHVKHTISKSDRKIQIKNLSSLFCWYHWFN